MNDERQTMNTQQLELTFDGSARFEAPIRSRGRVARAQWWFDQLHKLVRDAVTTPRPARPEQRHLAISRPGRGEWVTGGLMPGPLAGSRS